MKKKGHLYSRASRSNTERVCIAAATTTTATTYYHTPPQPTATSFYDNDGDDR